MKQTIEINIPDGYELDSRGQDSMVYDNPMKRSYVSVYIKQKQTKTFDWYVDQYLDTAAGSTNDDIRNWFEKDQLDKLANNLKQNNLNFVPWEVKIGLLKFICNDKRIAMSNLPFDFYGFDYLKKMCPNGFVESIMK